jgi:tetratricopeptide (TPR) repeat protein
MLKDYEGALEDFTRAVQASPHSAHIYFNRANLYVTMNRLEKAEDDYNKGLKH